ncbi:MAG: hypothetical protein ABSB35_09020 [Bryobacteraceae bacterium]
MSAQALSITNYQAVSQQVVTPSLCTFTYRADVVNAGPSLGSVTARLTSSDIFAVRALPATSDLNFAPVPANSQVTSSNHVHGPGELRDSRYQPNSMDVPDDRRRAHRERGTQPDCPRRQYRYVERQRFDDAVRSPVV